MVSAIKKDGVPLYKMARKGIEIEREPRKIEVFEFEVTGFENPLVHFRVDRLGRLVGEKRTWSRGRPRA